MSANSPKYSAQDGASAFVSARQEENGALNKETARLYKSFMQSYVKRINDSTYRVSIEGIRIGSAKYSRLAQINLKTRIITFSRFAIENVPERGRRYLVLHELAHVLEASHNKNFWNLVGSFEPDFKDIGLSLDRAFKQNVESHDKTLRALKRKARYGGTTDSAANQPQFRPSSIIWTPDHGYVEPGSKRFGLHRDPKVLFLSDGANQISDAEAEEAYEAYLHLKEENTIEEENLVEEASCVFDDNSATDRAQNLLVYEDEDDFDLLYGTISGGEE